MKMHCFSLRNGILICFITACAMTAYAAEKPACSKQEEKTLLSIARATLQQYLNEHRTPVLAGYAITEALQSNCGVFVTLKENNSDNLRGCIGYILGVKPLAEAVVDCTIQAATRDRRFRPMKEKEDDSVYISISVLSPPKKVARFEDIEIGRHGLIITKGNASGVLLPQIPIEWGWDRNAYLKAICKKAGLHEAAWQDPDTELYSFTAQVFDEHSQ